MFKDYYLKLLNYDNVPEFLKKYLEVPTLQRLKEIGYFCGMDYASKKIYDFKEYVSRYDHSLTVALLVYKLTEDKTQTLAGLFHDVSTPCFSHVIDYMNKDYVKQESTEKNMLKVIESDSALLNLLREDKIKVDEIVDFKEYTIVDNDRPKLCVDRLDGIIQTGYNWTKEINLEDIDTIINDIKVYKNEQDENEIGFRTREVAEKVLAYSDKINEVCHSSEDNYMMELLAKITRYSINKGYITYDELFTSTEKVIFEKFDSKKDSFLEKLLVDFRNLDSANIPYIELPNVKNRNINPLVKGKRLVEE